MSQNFDLNTTTSNTPNSNNNTTQDNNEVQRWVPQPSTNQFEQPRILEYGPLQGQIGDNFYINIANVNTIDPNLLKIAFDSCITTCHFTLNTVTQIITIHCIVPNCDLSTRVPIYLILQQAEQILDSWFIGYFTIARKRRISATSSIENESKRQRQSTEPSFQINTTSYQPQQQSNYYGLTSHAPYVGLPPTQPSPRQREYFEENPMLGYPSTSTTNFTPQDPTSFQPPFDDGNYASTAQQQQDPYIMPLMESMQQSPSTILTPSNTTTNTTTTGPNLQIKPTLPLPLQQQPSTTNYSTSTSSISPNISSSQAPAMLTPDPFANLLNKANLRFEGELVTMTQNWTPEEWEAQRRLVQFWRKQEGNEVTCKFEPFQMPTEKSKQPDLTKIIVVSCIYYQEKNDYFITSVDCIYLLEHLIGVKFTVEEKNRIRRNLEGYKPLTVSKLKPESADFFKLIMGFPNPKPRNIEKDVKVFPWSILGVALKKIISKYTASYSSTASVNYDVLTNTTTNTSSTSPTTTTATTSNANTTAETTSAGTNNTTTSPNN